jgi:hypothetical protein
MFVSVWVKISVFEAGLPSSVCPIWDLVSHKTYVEGACTYTKAVTHQGLERLLFKNHMGYS